MQVELSVVVEGQEFVLAPSADFGGGLFIPDIVGECFLERADVHPIHSGPNHWRRRALLWNSFFMNFEHSYMGDLIDLVHLPQRPKHPGG